MMILSSMVDYYLGSFNKQSGVHSPLSCNVCQKGSDGWLCLALVNDHHPTRTLVIKSKGYVYGI